MYKRIDPYELSDEQFFSRYRFPKDTVVDTCDKYSTQLERCKRRSTNLSVETQLCCALRYFSQGGYLPVIGDLHGISARSASKCIHDVAKIASNDYENYVTWPSQDDQNTAKARFYNYSSFPRVIGVVDGCHVKIASPSLPFHETAFVNRKGWHSINCHFVCDFDLKIFDVSTKWPGSAHDSFIFQQSPLWSRRDQLIDTNAIILGDSAYPQTSWLMTPCDNPVTSEQQRYNRAHKRGRSVIERCNGVLKSRFRCLQQTINFSPIRASRIIRACVCLHNLAIKRNVELPP